MKYIILLLFGFASTEYVENSISKDECRAAGFVPESLKVHILYLG